jgi:hypothetical protein
MTNVENGGRTGTTGEHPISHDFIELSQKTPALIYDKCAPLYKKGHSLRDIEEQTGYPRSTIRDALKAHNFPIRSRMKTLKGEKTGKPFKCAGYAPYGFAYLDGQLVIDPKEHIIVRKILKLRQHGLSYRAIANELNKQKIPTRNGKSWYLSFIKTIIDRNQ